MVEKSITPERLLEILNEDSSYCIPPLLAPATNKKLSKHPTLLPGEKILLQQDAICVETYLSPVEGTLHLTTFRVIFSGSSPDIEDEAIGGDHHTSLVSKKNSSQFGKKKGFSDTLERFREKAQHFQKNLQHSKSCRTLRSTYKGKSQFTLNRSHENNVVQTSCGENLDDNCKLISLQPVDTPESDETEKDLVQHDIIVSIPCTNVYDIHKLPKNSLVKDPRFFGFGDGIELMCSTLQVYKFCLPQGSDYNADKLAAIFSKYTKHLSPSKWFAIAYREAISHTRSCDILYSRTSQNFYDFEVEFRRLGLLTLDCWREYSPNGLLETKAPKKTLIPHGISDVEMNNIITFHGDRSFPSICWRNSVDGTVMLRCGSALYRRGIFEYRCESDENFLASVCFQNKQSNGDKMVIFTEQSRTNSTSLLTTPAQQLSGQITPKQGEAFCYPHVKFVYTDKEIIPDHKIVKQSSVKLQTLLAAECDDKTFLSDLAETQWLSQISELLETTSLVITAMSADKLSVLISYEYGCDRTAQLSSLSQLLLDPHYRTIDGFQILIQKEWLSFGHMFAERCISPKSDEGHGPIFLQWLDCVWQLLNQFPYSFEFNEGLLQTIADHVYSCRFGTFLCDSEQQFQEEEIDNKTLSLWTWINLTVMADPEKFINNNYMKTKTERILIPRYHIPSLKVWESYYATSKFEAGLQEAKQIAKEQRKLQEDLFANMLDKHQDLLRKRSNIPDDGQNSESSIEYDISCIITSESKEELFTDVAERFEIKTGSLKAKNVRNNNSMRSTESKSLDNLLQNRRQETDSKIKRRFGSSKFYVNKPTRKKFFDTALAEFREDKTDETDSGKKSRMFNGLCDYLDHKGIDWRSEKDIEITPIVCCGFLTKRGFVRKNWLPRWFKLDLRKNCLAYFEKREDQIPKGVIECGKILQVYSADKPGKADQHKFYAVTDERTFAFKASSESLMKIWMATLSLKSNSLCIR
ncbi:myotubularin-related protein 13-like isoform X2 [Dendronephthya gigantea]|uniref:myotubularin-related protein 13-like isoform X2 n=1 Tax=Dendronephthya gigantea TaxID=151771 RepID=UPI0010694881|nr:myotubularin-related protein 13-like isoform X2 [Dendronephthya gigantea]